ncbi:hypothetical protein AWC38_SpisGene16193 [Stylophora pistillata]|uniref:Uncharacterized protein n=1 Tax=Stylophora pistillata TaxID=50429 RepID=A0A2B4RLX1_STYPI|nr:hypothetical protein AWC38_SpisGene16193 [Stylophora pistillata]
MATAGALFRKTFSQTRWSCEAKTKYSCISCDRPVCVRLECSVAQLDEYAEGWELGKRVGYCLPCARIYTRTSTPRSPEASILVNLVDETSSLSKQNDQDSDLSSDSEEKKPQVPNKKRRKQPKDGHCESPEETATATGVKRLTDEKGYGKWFDVLYPIVKSRDSCQPEQAREPSANESSAKEIIENGSSDCSTVEGSTKEPPEKSMFVLVKKKGRKHKSDQIASTVDLIRSVIENDPTKYLLEGIHEEMKLAREQENRYLDILLGSGHYPSQQYQHHGAYSSTPMFSNNGVPGNQTQTGIMYPPETADGFTQYIY